MARTDEAPGYGALWSNRRFRRFFGAEALGDAGYAVYAIVVPWLAYSTGGGAVAVGAVLAVEFGVYALSFLVGPIIDRVHDLRAVLLVGYPVQAALAALLAVRFAAGGVGLPDLLALVAAISLAWDFTWTASNKIVPVLVDGPLLYRANSLLGAISGGNQLAGYAAGAGLLLVVGTAGGLALYAALNGAAAIVALGVHARTAPAAPRRFLDGLREGFRYFASPAGRPLFALVVAGALEGGVSAAPIVLLPLVVGASLAGSEGGYAALFSAFAFGSIFGSFVLGVAAPRQRLGRVIGIASAAEGLLLLGAVVMGGAFGAALPLWFAVGSTDVAVWLVLTVALQSRVPAALFGRAFTNAYFFRGSARALGAFGIGIVAIGRAPTVTAAIVAAAFVAVGAVAVALGRADDGRRFDPAIAVPTAR